MDRYRHVHLTPREVECLERLARGFNNAGIAQDLHISLPTVALHLVNARKKLGAHTREEALARAIKQHLIEF
jgi:LuxR family transcriptional regulator